MEKQYKNRFLAWLFDAFILECLIFPVRFFILGRYDLFVLVAIFLLLVLFSATIIFHVRWTHNTQWISPGEKLIGIKIISEKKVQTNPFRISRFSLFAIFVLNLLTIITTLDSSTVTFFGQTEMLYLWLIGSAYNLLIMAGMWLLSQVKRSGLYLIIAGYLIMIVSRFVNYSWYDMPTYKNTFWQSVVFLIVNVLIGGYYFYMQVAKPTSERG